MSGSEGALRRCPVEVAAAQHPDRPALISEACTFTWRDVAALVTAWTGRLAALGVGAGDAVMLRSHNRPEVLWVHWAAARLQAFVVPLNARLSDSEVLPLVARVSPRVLLVEASPKGAGPASLAPAGARTLAFEDVPSGHAPQERAWRFDAPLVGLFTSGTTGQPKLVIHGARQLEAAARASAARIGGGTAPVWLGTLPLFHVGGLAMAFRVLFSQGTLVLFGRFDARATNEAMDRHRVTHASFVATTLQRVLEDRQGRAFDAAVQAALIGGGPVEPELLVRSRALGLPCLQTYGMTEACSQLTTEAMDDADGRTAGVPLPGTEVRIVDPDGRPLKAGAEGSIEVRGPTLFSHYFEDSEATAAAWRGGWFCTGDLGVMDARGRLRVLSRRTDLIVRGGENVYPAELEQLIATHPDVAEVAVVGMPDPEWGQVPVALVVPRRPVSVEALSAWVAVRLAGFKRPTRWVEVEALPRNAMGKVERSRLQGLAEALTCRAPQEAPQFSKSLHRTAGARTRGR